MTRLNTGHGSPVAPDSGESGHGSPVSAIGGESGWGGPIFYSEDGPQLPMSIRGKFQSDDHYARHGFDPIYSEDAGELVEVHASWPTKGPIRAQVRDATGALHPSDDSGCYGAIPGDGDQLFTNESQVILRFAIPRPIKRGTYDLVVSWDGGQAVATHALRIGPRSVPRETMRLLRMPALGDFLEARR